MKGRYRWWDVACAWLGHGAGVYLALHEMELLKGKRGLANSTPRLVGIADGRRSWPLHLQGGSGNVWVESGGHSPRPGPCIIELMLACTSPLPSMAQRPGELAKRTAKRER